ncbi:MAG: type II secretion system protein [Verrucomicrobiaceae bacterium]|nr:MAG: type II secretion system protein [Verrucomicrobiaceae bacterium]
MKKRIPPHSFSITAFTLVELLTVIAIIAILMSILFPVIAAVKENARKVQAKNDVMGIVTAVKAYNTEYGKYPTVDTSKSSGGGNDDEEAAVGDPAADIDIKNNALFNTLRALPEGLNEKHKYNPRRVVFFEGKSVSNPVQPRAGFLEKGAEDVKGCLYDPWGRQYNVVMDSNYDNMIKVKDYYSDVKEDESPRVGVAAFSLGTDNKLGTNGDKKIQDADDQVSWK